MDCCLFYIKLSNFLFILLFSILASTWKKLNTKTRIEKTRGTTAFMGINLLPLHSCTHGNLNT